MVCVVGFCYCCWLVGWLGFVCYFCFLLLLFVIVVVVVLGGSLFWVLVVCLFVFVLHPINQDACIRKKDRWLNYKQVIWVFYARSSRTVVPRQKARG